MISCDTNILYPACNADSPDHMKARTFLERHSHDRQFLLCEQALAELYCLLRNPVIARRPLDGPEAAAIIQRLRGNPDWRIVDVPGESRLMDRVWTVAAQRGFAYRRIFDVRLALTLRHHGVEQFATRNAKDFSNFGFTRVWDPLSQQSEPSVEETEG